MEVRWQRMLLPDDALKIDEEEKFRKIVRGSSSMMLCKVEEISRKQEGFQMTDWPQNADMRRLRKCGWR